MSRPSKRKRVERNTVYHTQRNTSYHDPVPLDEDFDVIHFREAAVRRVGDGVRRIVLPRSSLINSETPVPSWDPPDDPNFALDPDGQKFDELVDGNVMDDQPLEAEPMKQKKKNKRSRVSKRPHVVWMELNRQSYLDELLRWEGRGDARSISDCGDCLARSTNPAGPAEHRCKDCFVPDLTCASCCVRRHRNNPFHRVEKWTGSQFTHVSLKSLGLKVQLNHLSMYCENPVPCHTNLRILHTNGIHEVAIEYCGCSKAISHHVQLLRRGLYPTSQITVKTVVTFQLLQHLHHLALTTKASTYDFYRAIEKSTNNIGINVPKSRYRALLRAVLQWRHLKMLKRAGRGNDPTGVSGTRNGELAIQCPSCPLPGINLDDGWQNVPESMKFLYMAIICMDANFRLKNQLVSNYSQDPGLGIGWAYMISTCVGFQALAKANSKFSVGLRYTGANAVLCGRSEMVLPIGVGNTHKGERYANMDYIFGSALSLFLVSLVLISYDISCQWFVNLLTRMDEHWPEEIKMKKKITLIPAIPKLHEPMHGATGHQVYSLNYIPGVGLSDCECPERFWSSHNALGNSTKTQGPGSRHDVLDDHFGFWNWLKYVNMGATLLRRYRSAVAERNIQEEGHKGLTASLDPKIEKAWEQMCVEWEGDEFPKSKKNPYHVESATISEARVKKTLAQEEEKRLAAGGISLHRTTAPSFIELGLEIEETQRRIKRLSKSADAHSTTTKDGNLAEQRNMLRMRLRLWEQLVPIYVPGLLQYLADRPHLSPKEVPHPEDAQLWLPSHIPLPDRQKICREGLSEIEDQIREGQCSDSLEAVRRILRLKGRMVQFKNKNIRGQREGTRSRAIIDRVHDRARGSAAKYRAARAALLNLRGTGAWEDTFRPLEDGDVRSYQDPDLLRPRKGRQGIWEDGHLPANTLVHEDQDFTLYNEERSRRDGTGETRRTISWIWLNGRPEVDDAKDDLLRSEWAKSRARAARSREEVLLLKEEMSRVLKFLKWKARWWEARAALRADVNPDLAEGLRAFSLSQSEIQESLATHFRTLWTVPLRESANDALEKDGVDDSVDNTTIAEDDSDEDSDESFLDGQDSGVDSEDEDGKAIG